MGFINWGEDSSERKAIRSREEMEALYEQAIKIKMQSQQGQGGVGGSSGVVEPIVETVSSFFVLTKENDQPNFTYYIADYANNALIGPLNTGINSVDYYVSDSYSIYNKGYFILFRQVADSNNYTMMFFDKSGNVLSSVSGTTSDLITYKMEGQWLVATDYDARWMWYFDGETVTEELDYLQDTDSFTIGLDGDPSCSLGFSIKTIKPDGTQTFCLVNNTGVTELYSYNATANPSQAYSLFLYNRSTKAMLTHYDGVAGYHSTLRFFDLTTGLQEGDTIDLLADEYTSADQYLYGEGNYALLYNSATDYLFVNYNVSTSEFFSVVVSQADYPSYWVDWDKYSLFSCNDHPIHNTFSMIFYKPTGFQQEGLFELDACKAFYTINNSSVIEEDLKVDGVGPSLKTVSPHFNKNYLFFPADIGDSMFSAIVLKTMGRTNLSTGLSFDDINGWSLDRVGEKIVFRLAADTATEAYVLNQAGTSLTRTTLGEQNANNSWIDYDVFTAYSTTGISEYRLNNATNTFIEMPRFDERHTADLYTNPLLKEVGIIIGLYNGEIAYTHTQMPDVVYGEASLEDFVMDGAVVAGTADTFGPGSSYFTNLYPGMFVLCAKNMNISEFKILGDIGTDGNGDVDNYTETVIYNGQSYTAYIKRVYGTGDPSINHIIIVKGDGAGITQIIDSSTEYDDHIISNIPASVTELHYILLSQDNGVKVENADITQVINDYLAIAHNKTAQQTLTDLNAGYETVVGNVPAPYLFNDNPEDNSPNIIGDGGGDMYDGANIIFTSRSKTTVKIIKSTSVSTSMAFPQKPNDFETGPNFIAATYYDSTNNGNISFSVYNLSGNLKYTVKTPYSTVSRFAVVGDRLIVITYDIETIDDEDYSNTAMYIGNLNSYKSTLWTAIGSQPAPIVMPNDTTWWD